MVALFLGRDRTHFSRIDMQHRGPACSARRTDAALEMRHPRASTLRRQVDRAGASNETLLAFAAFALLQGSV